MPRLPYWDKKFYYQIHVNRQLAQWNQPVWYYWFITRLRRWMNLHDAIYTPKTTADYEKVIQETEEDIERRRRMLNDENITVVDLEELVRLETELMEEDTLRELEEIWEIKRPKPRKPHKPMIPKPKPTLWNRFISLFK